MKDKNIVLIRVIGIINILLGLMVLLPFLKLLLLAKFNLGYFCDLPNPCLIFIFSIIISLLLPLAKCITGYGLIRLKEWGRYRTIFVMLIDFIVRLFGAINVCMYSFVCISIISNAEENCVERVSLCSSYLIAFFNLIVVFILTRKAFKDIFTKD